MQLKKVFGIIIIVFLVVAGLGVWLYQQQIKLSSSVNIEKPAATVNVTVKINFSSKLLDYPVTVSEPATVLTALQAIKDLPVKVQDYGQLGQLVTAIGDQVNGQDGKYWQYWLNGVYAQVGADHQSIKAGDAIEWKFTQHFEDVKNR